MKKIAILPLFLLMNVLLLAQGEDNEIIRIQKKRELAACEVMLYPNPSTDRVFIKAPRGSSCEIYSSHGTYVGTWKIEEEGVELNDLGSGTYFAVIRNEGALVRRNFVIL